MTSIYVQNRSPHRILKDMTPEEAFSGKKPNVEHLKIFGRPIYFHIPKDKRKNLEPSGKKGIFVVWAYSLDAVNHPRPIESISWNNIRLKSAET